MRGIIMKVVSGIFFGIAILFGCLLGYFLHQQSLMKETYTETVPATVINVNYDYDNEEDAYFYNNTYQYHFGGKTYEFKSKVYTSTKQNNVGDKIILRINPNNPEEKLEDGIEDAIELIKNIVKAFFIGNLSIALLFLGIVILRSISRKRKEQLQ